MRNPFIAGNWVRGEHFFGRDALLEEILTGPRPYVWVMGTRRMGKTSLLKQLEWMCSSGPHASRFLPLFWDLEGSGDLAGLRESLLESVEAAAERFQPVGLRVDDLEALDLFAALRLLKRKVREAGTCLLLLCDECEELLHVGQTSPGALSRLRRVFQEGESTRTVLTATKRLALLDRSPDRDTSPFLNGFVPPLYLSHLEAEACETLIARGGFAPEASRRIQAHAGNHPYLTQLLCRRLLESGDLDAVLDDVRADDMVSRFFAVDFEALETDERDVLLQIVRGGAVSSMDLQAATGVGAPRMGTLLQGLEKLGYVVRDGGLCRIAVEFFEIWLRREHGIAAPGATDPAAAAFDAESSLELLRRAREGSHEALVHLCERYRTAFHVWADGRVPHRIRGQVDTEQLLRDTLESALERLNPHREGELWEFLRQELWMHIRARADAAPAAVPSDTAGPGGEDPRACPVEEIVGREALQRYESGLGRLRPEERQAVVTRIEMCCTYQQVADLLGKPSEGAARMAVCRALVRLAREMSA